jgi:two-component system response regulator YesN
MLRAMLVDDERMALEGLKLLIDWRAEGFVVCAECASAAETLSRLTELKPDLIVSDIRMPGMDGLALMEAARARGFDGQFVIVSGYGDFDYAKQAMRVGVAGYLLKPIEPSDASEVLSRVRKALINREAGSQPRSAYHRSLTAHLSGGTTHADALPSGEHWRLATWGSPLPLERLNEILGAFPEGAASSHIVEDKEYLALHWPSGEREPSWHGAEALIDLTCRKVHKSKPVDLGELPAERASLAAVLYENLDALEAHVREMNFAVALRQVEAFKLRCAEMETLCRELGVDAKARVRRHLITEYTRLLKDRPEALARLLAAQDADVMTLGLLTIELLAPVKERISGQVLRYAQAHLAQRLTLEDVAEALGYNPTYLGRVFREELGEAFREWLFNHRMEKAAALLHETDAQIADIANTVGYAHYKRFLAHFKRRYGQTPEQYRKNKSGKGNAL